MKAKAVKLLLALFFLFPFSVLFFYFKIKFDYNFEEILWALKNSLIQSLSTAALSVFFGFFGALGLLQVKGRWHQVLKFLVAVPVFLPSLFSILIGISIIYFTPLGSLGVIYFLTLINIGFAASVICEEITAQLGQLGFVGEVYGLTKTKFLYKILWPLVRKSVGFVFIVIFVNSMTAFTIPLLVGGSRGTNFEVLIYEKIFIDQNWASAVGLGLMQLAMIAVFAFLLQNRPTLAVREFKSSRLIGSYVGLAGLALYIKLYFWSYIKLFWESLDAYFIPEMFNAEFCTAIYNSLILFVFCLAVFAILFLGVLYLKYEQQNLKFINFFLNPSSVLVGFGFYLLLPANHFFYSMLKIALVIGVVSFVGFMKLVFENQMHLFESQVKVAKSFGVNYLHFVFKIYFPQIKKRLHYAISLLFIFSVSEFGLIKVSGAEINTLGTEMASYLSSYRSEGAFVISLVILAIWLIATIISGAALGVYKKS
ncbi:hypothetical protein CIK05_02835 [Bdellovibrio sp. qaytius]|nr:hypothetical protein CIK05_02835 [Bdellovibrio sp. qaytius]